MLPDCQKNYRSQIIINKIRREKYRVHLYPPSKENLHPPRNTPLHSIFEAKHHRPIKFPEYLPLPINHNPTSLPPWLLSSSPSFAWLVHFSLSTLEWGGRPPPARVPFGSVQKLRLACAGIYDLRPLASPPYFSWRGEKARKTRARVLSRARRGHRGYPLAGVTPWGHPRDSRLAMGTSRLDQRSWTSASCSMESKVARAMVSCVVYWWGRREGILEYCYITF